MSRGCRGGVKEVVSRVSRVKLCVSVVECRGVSSTGCRGVARVESRGVEGMSRGCRGGVEGVEGVSRVGGVLQ